MKALRLVMASALAWRRCELSTPKPTFRPMGRVYPPQTRSDFCCPAGLDAEPSGIALQALAPNVNGPPDHRLIPVVTLPLAFWVLPPTSDWNRLSSWNHALVPPPKSCVPEKMMREDWSETRGS